MSKYSLRWTSNAVGQLKTAVDYLERFSEKSADRILDEMIGFADSFAGMPMCFPECPDFPIKSETYMKIIFHQTGI